MKYYIIICDKFSDMFIDLAQQLLYFLSCNNIETSIQEYSPQFINSLKTDERCIFFGTDFKSKIIPSNSVLTIFDTLIHFNNIIPDSLLHTNTILHYNTHEINSLQLKNNNSLSIYYFKMGYNPYLDKQYSLYDRSILYDAVFIGNISPRRKYIIDNLLSKGYKVFYGGYSPKYYTLSDIIPLYKRSRVVLALYTDERTLNCTLGSRVYPAISTNNFVITEESTNELANQELSTCSTVASYDKIISTVEYYITHDVERLNLLEKYYSYIRNTPANIELSAFI